MSKGVNKVILVGNLGKDPEMKYTSNGIAVAKFSLATNKSYKDREGNTVDTTAWHNIVVWRKLAEICAEFLKKGSKIYMEGTIDYRSWDKDDGTKGYMTEIVMEEMVMLDSRSGGGEQRRHADDDAPDASPRIDDLPF